MPNASNHPISRPRSLRKPLAIAAALAVLAVGLTGCGLTRHEPESVGVISLPQPAEEAENMILGETLSNGFSDVTMYFSSADGTGFSTVTRSMRTDAGTSLPEAAVNALLASGGEELGRPIGDTRVLACEYTCGTVTVDLSIDARNVQSPMELLSLIASIENTLLGIDGVAGVNVLIGDLNESVFQLPLGVQTEPLYSVAALYAQLQAERERLSRTEPAPIQRGALLYFPTATGDWLVPELRGITAESGGFVNALIDALTEGPVRETCAIASIPEGVELLDPDPGIRVLPSGERILDLNFSSTLANYLAFSGLEVWELAGSLALTMCSFLPELDAVRIMVNGDPITMCELGENIIHFPDGLIHRRDFSGCIGSTATLYLVGASGALEPMQRAVSMRSALSPRSLLATLLRYAGNEDGGPRLPRLNGVIYPEDVLGVQASGGIARVNLSGNLYRACQSLNSRDERDLVYAMVNTLCRLESIRGVRFYVEGCAADTLAGAIYLKSVLLPNPGIVAGTPIPSNSQGVEAE